MAEIQMFQPGTAFMNSYNQAKAGSLAKIAFTEPQRRQSALADLYGLDPQATNSMKKEFDAQEQEQLKTFATAFMNTTDDNLRTQMYGRAKEMWRPRFQALGSDIPDDWRQALPTIQAIAGISKNGKFTGAPIIIQTPNGPRYARYSESDIVPTDFAPSDSYRLEIDPATGQPYRFGTRSGQFEQASGGYGGANQAPPAGNGGIVFPQDISGAAQRTGDVMQQVRTEIAQLVAQGVPVADATSQVTQKYARQRGLTMPPQGQAPAPVVQQPVASTVAQRPVPQYGGYQGMSAAEKARAEAEAKADVELQYAPQVEAAKLGVQLETAPRLEGAKAEEQAAGKARGERAATGEKRASEAGDAIELLNQAEELLRTATGGYFGAKADEFAAAFGKSTKGAEANAQLNVIAPKLIGLVPRFEGPQSDADRKLYENAAGDLGNPNKPASIRLAAARRMMQLYQKAQQNQSSGNGQQKRIRITL